MTDTASTQTSTLEPVASLKWDSAGDGTFYAQLTVSGLKSEQQAHAAIAHLRRLFCGQEQDIRHD